MNDATAAQDILAMERSALGRWSKGDPVGYFALTADDATYFDDIGAQRRVDGIAALREYARSLEGSIPPHTYELLDPMVQVYGDIGILTLGYLATGADGRALPPWKATVVYRRSGAAWRRVHAHWSISKSA